MQLFLFRNSDTRIDYCLTESKSGDNLPCLRKGARWLRFATVSNAVDAAIFGVMDFDTAKSRIERRGYFHYTDHHVFRIAS